MAVSVLHKTDSQERNDFEVLRAEGCALYRAIRNTIRCKHREASERFQKNVVAGVSIQAEMLAWALRCRAIVRYEVIVSETRATMHSPFEQLGGRAAVEALAYRFYERMDVDEPELAALHRLDTNGKVAQRSRDAFARFLVFWLGGPDDYLRQDGHPRLRMRHAPVKIDAAMRDAWVRCMQSAMNDCSVSGEIRGFLDARFAEVAEFLVNHPSEQAGAGLGISLRGPARTPSAPK